jgi:tetratricopeptide (TPR) repeat protein
MATMEQQRISWGELRERAHALRLKSLKAGEPGLSVRVSDLLETLPLPYDPEPLPDDATQEEILEAEREPLDFAEDVLKRHGVRTRPAPGDVGEGGVVVLRPSNRYAIQGAVGIGLLALLAGGVLSKIAFIGFLPFVVVGVWIAWRQMHRLDRWVPRVVPRGRILGALLMIVLLAISALVVVQPARDWARQRGDVRNAVALSVQAEAQLAAGDLGGARASVDGALQAAPELGQVIATSQKVMVAQINANTAAQLQAQAVTQSAYDRGLAAYADRRWSEAITDLTAAGAYADAPTQLAEVRRAAAEASLRSARTALAAGEAAQAFDLYSQAITFDPTAADRALVDRIGKALRAGS